jgi:hypothetical protein
MARRLSANIAHPACGRAWRHLVMQTTLTFVNLWLVRGTPRRISAPFIEARPAAQQVKRDEVGGRCQAPNASDRVGLAGDDRLARARSSPLLTAGSEHDLNPAVFLACLWII